MPALWHEWFERLHLGLVPAGIRGRPGLQPGDSRRAIRALGYGIGLQKHSLWADQVTLALLGMHESEVPSPSLIHTPQVFSHPCRILIYPAAIISKVHLSLSCLKFIWKSWTTAGFLQGSETCEKNEKFPATLGLKNMAGVFILVGAGIVGGVGLIIIEIIYKKHQTRKQRRLELARHAADKWRSRRGAYDSEILPFNLDTTPRKA
ncbi:glutamate receptor subunit 1 [Caerostris extrusa]|uniref:Glutamate receptor subunit 1 n=1 Tax=Caerostris extrusa TaxID=172846 RepID=A0AAV4UIJ4_CAEEX|nr:glutamate receptor subunit 1 [Caerostris extrusa]